MIALKDSFNQNSQAVISRPATDFPLDVARGLVQGFKVVNKFGNAPNGVQTTTTDIWTRSDAAATQQIWLAPTQQRIHAIVSSAAADAVGGTGAKSVTISGLIDWNTKEITETVTLTGQTPVNTVNPYVIIHRMVANAQATTTIIGVNAGLITATAATNSTITAEIVAAKGQTQMAIYGIPSTQDFYMTNFTFRVADTGATVWVRGGIVVNSNPHEQTVGFVNKEVFGAVVVGSSAITNDYSVHYKISGPAIIKVQAIASAADKDSSATFSGILVDK